MTGFIQDAQFDVSRFNDERVRFDNTGVTMNPTDGAGITSSLYIGHLSEKVASQQKLSKKARRREIKAKRQKFGDACKADFQGPWANYEGMEEFKG